MPPSSTFVWLLGATGVPGQWRPCPHEASRVLPAIRRVTEMRPSGAPIDWQASMFPPSESSGTPWITLAAAAAKPASKWLCGRAKSAPEASRRQRP